MGQGNAVYVDNVLVVYVVDFPQFVRASSDGVSSDGVSSFHERTIGAAVEIG